MGKIKSALITALFVAAIIVLAFFATVSFDLNGGVNRYNSFVSSIRLGGDLTGNAYATLYPEGVISVADYELVTGDNENTDREEYEKKYVDCGGVYVSKDKLGYEYDGSEYTLAENAEEIVKEFKQSVKNDAEILVKRFGDKKYSSYSVTLEDGGYAIKVSVPTNFTYSAYKDYDSSLVSSGLSEISSTVTYLSYSGEISLRDSNVYKGSESIVSVVKHELKDFFSGAGVDNRGGANAIYLSLTGEGFESLNEALTNYSGSASSAYFFVGETCLGLSVTIADGISSTTMYYQPSNVSASGVQDVAILLNSVISGDVLTNVYNDDAALSNTGIVATTSTFGENAPVYLFAALLAVVAAAVIIPSIKYKKLGLVNALSVLAYALIMVTAIMLIDIQVTIAGAFTAVLGLALLLFANFISFEAIRKETLTGRTIHASVKLGYKKTISTVLDMHIVLVIIAAMLTLIGVGETAACGFIFFIATLASYVLYWFTRFMWYVISSPVRDKFAFCGFKREVDDDED